MEWENFSCSCFNVKMVFATVKGILKKLKEILQFSGWAFTVIPELTFSITVDILEIPLTYIRR